MPLVDYISEVMALLSHHDQAGSEILVNRVKLLRGAERSGRYDEIFTANNDR